MAERCAPEIVVDGQSWGLTIQSAGWRDPAAPYRVAIAFSEMFPELVKNGRVRIVTYLADAGIAEQTRSGRFDFLEANRSFATKHLLRYFCQDGTTWVANRQLREMLELRRSPSGLACGPGPTLIAAAPLWRANPDVTQPDVTQPSLSRESLIQSTESVVARLFGPAVEVRPDPHSFSDAGAVGVVGTRTETVVVRVSRDLLTAYTSSVFSVHEADVVDLDRSDALLELVDVLGGSARTGIPGEATLTVPYALAVSRVDRDAATAGNVVSFSTAKGLLSILTVLRPFDVTD